jgi:hypothetical protein
MMIIVGPVKRMTDNTVTQTIAPVQRTVIDKTDAEIEDDLKEMAAYNCSEIVDRIIKEHEEKMKDPAYAAEFNKGQDMTGWGLYLAMGGKVELEYSGRAHKNYKGDAVLLLKPDDSIVVHGVRGVAPISYMSRPSEIRGKGKDGQLTISATSGNERLIVTFTEMTSYEDLIRYDNQPEKLKPVDDWPPYTEEERNLGTELKKLRVKLAFDQRTRYLPAIFNNRMLDELVRRKPRRREEILAIRGFGPKRVEKYSEAILAVVRESFPEVAGSALP